MLSAIWADRNQTVAERMLDLVDDRLAAVTTDGSVDRALQESGIDAYFASTEDDVRIQFADDWIRRIQRTSAFPG